MIRAGCPDDAPEIAAIYAWHVLNGTATFEIEAPSIDDMATRIASILSKKAAFLVAEENGAIMGYAYFTPFRDRPAYRYACENSIYLHHEARGRGLGTALLAALIIAAEQAGYRQMIAVAASGDPASVALHSKLGFDHRGTMQSVGRKFGQWLDTVYMQRSLGEGNETPPPVEP